MCCCTQGRWRCFDHCSRVTGWCFCSSAVAVSHCPGDLLSLLFAGELLLPKTSLHLGTTLTRASSVGKWPLLLTCPSCSCQLSVYHQLLSFLLAFCVQVFHSAFNKRCGIFDCFVFVFACYGLQHLLYQVAIHLIVIVYDDLPQDCPFWFFDGSFRSFPVLVQTIGLVHIHAAKHLPSWRLQLFFSSGLP